MSASIQHAVDSSSNPDLSAQLSAILSGAAVAPLDSVAWLRVSGPDATRWLNGMVTNNIADLAPGEGNYNFLLNAQGRILGDCTIYRDPTPEPAAYLLETDASQIDAIQQHLDKFIIMDDVELQRLDFYRQTILLLGPKSAETLGEIENFLDDEATHADLQPLRTAHYPLTASQLTTPSPELVPQFEIASTMYPDVLEQLQVAGATPVSPSALEALRILSGTPRYGVDIRNTDTAHDLPQETAQTRALHFSKGCYLGQEIVERIRSRGNVHRTFAGFQLTGELPAPGTQLTAESFPRPVGELTSVAAIPLPTGPIQLALGYIRREALDRNLPLEYPGGTATPVSLPWRFS